MEKARYLLWVLGIITVFAVFFSFKTKSYSEHFSYTGALNSGVCTTKVAGIGITNGWPPNAAGSFTSLTVGCPNVFAITIENQ